MIHIHKTSSFYILAFVFVFGLVNVNFAGANNSISTSTNSCPIFRKGTGKINFLVVPNRNITQNEIDNGVFKKYISDIFFGRSDAYYYTKDGSGLAGLAMPAPGFFDIKPLNEYKDLISIYYYNTTTKLDCELANTLDGNPPQNCYEQANSIRDKCSNEIKSDIDRVIVIDTVGWDSTSSLGKGSMWFNNYHTYQYYTGPEKGFVPVFETGRVAAHEFGHTLGFGHSEVAPLQSSTILPVDNVISYSSSVDVSRNNCDNLTSTKWCKGVDVNSICLKDFQEFLDSVKHQCGTNPTLDCEKSVWNSYITQHGHEPLDSSCNIGLSCENNAGSYLSSCDGNPFLTSSGGSVMGNSFFTFSPYESKLIRNTLSASTPSVPIHNPLSPITISAQSQNKGELTLSWTSVSWPAGSVFEIERAMVGGTSNLGVVYNRIGVATGDMRTYTDTGILPSLSADVPLNYSYQIRAKLADGTYSAYSNAIPVTITNNSVIKVKATQSRSAVPAEESVPIASPVSSSQSSTPSPSFSPSSSPTPQNISVLSSIVNTIRDASINVVNSVSSVLGLPQIPQRIIPQIIYPASSPSPTYSPRSSPSPTYSSSPTPAGQNSTSGNVGTGTPTPSSSPSSSPIPSSSPKITVSPTPTVSASPRITTSPTVTVTPRPSTTPSPTYSSTPSPTYSSSPSPTVTNSPSPSSSPTPARQNSTSGNVGTGTPSPTPTVTQSPSSSPSPSPSSVSSLASQPTITARISPNSPWETMERTIVTSMSQPLRDIVFGVFQLKSGNGNSSVNAMTFTLNPSNVVGLSNFKLSDGTNTYSGTLSGNRVSFNNISIPLPSDVWRDLTFRADVAANVNGTQASVTFDGSMSAPYVNYQSVNISIPSAISAAPVHFFLDQTTSTAIPSITIVSPNGGEVYKTGDPFRIQWSTTNADLGSKVNLSMLYETTDGVPHEDVISAYNIFANAGYYQYTIPAYGSGIKQGSFKVKIVMIGSPRAGVMSQEDYSNNYFTVNIPLPLSLAVTIDSSVAIPTAVNAGSSRVNLFATKYYASGGDVMINGFQIKSNDVDTQSKINNLRLYDGGSLVASAGTAEVSPNGMQTVVYPFTFSSSIPSGGSKTFIVVGDIPSSASGVVRFSVAGVYHGYGGILNFPGSNFVDGTNIQINPSSSSSPSPTAFGNNDSITAAIWDAIREYFRNGGQ